MKKHIVVGIAMSFVVATGGVGRVSGSAVAQDAGRRGGPNPVVAWNEHAGAAAVAACLAPGNDPLHESRLYTMTHLAIHDALNGIHRRSEPYTFRPSQQVPWASPDAAVSAAAREVLVPVIRALPFPQACIDAGVASVEADYARALASLPAGPATTAGLALGRDAAAAVLALRSNDGSDTTLQDFTYPQGTAPGEYRFTPGFDFAFLPGWSDVTPFVLSSSTQFLPPPPYPVTSRRYAADLNEVKRLGGDGVTTPTARTPHETETALFWVEPPLAWNRIARTVATDRHLGTWESARLFGLLNMAMTDGYIGSWEAKFDTYNYWRPVTAIREAGTDGNPLTAPDPTWTPLVPTPPIPDYDSGHATEGGAAAAVLRGFFGTDRVTFTACSLTLPAGDTCADATPVVRTYHSFSQAAMENGRSRILVGFHFRKAVRAGITHGRLIGERAVSRFLCPVGPIG